MPARAATQNARNTAANRAAAALAAWQRGDTAFAEKACHGILLRDPTDRSATRLLGIIAYQSGRHAEALPLLRTVCDGPADHSNLGAVLRALGRCDEAEEEYRRAIALDPNLVAAHYNLGNLLHDQARHADAAAAFDAALQIRSDYAEAWNGLGKSLQRQGRLREAAKAFGRAVQCAPANVEMLTDLGTVLIALERNAEAQATLHQALAQDPSYGPAHGNLGAMLARAGRPIAGKSACRTAIALAPGEHRWLTNLGVALLTQGRYTEAEACERQALALRPDFAEYQERDRRYAKHFASASPPFTLDRVAPLPALTNGFVTFGYFGRTERLNDAVIAAWARILRDVPGARLMLNSLPFREPAFRDLIAARFAAQDVDRDRLELIATSPQSTTWADYGGIDIALDRVPHNASTTTIEALSLGVPVVSLAERPSVGRFGAMILHAVGLDDWVSADTDDYVARAIAAATDLHRLAQVRATLRQRVAASPLCDAAGLARHVEAAYLALCDAC